MNNIILIGQLICQSDDKSVVVTEFLPRHLELTLAESGRISFEVEQSDNPWVWDVSGPSRTLAPLNPTRHA